MANEARVEELQEMIPFLAAEQNANALIDVIKELERLGADSGNAKFWLSAVEMAMQETERDERKYVQQLKAVMEKLTDVHEINRHFDLMRQFRKACPFSSFALELDYDYLQPKGKQLKDAFPSAVEHMVALTKVMRGEGDRAELLLRPAAERVSIPNKDYEMAFAVYIALKDYPAARFVRYQQGLDAVKRGDGLEAHKYFLAALDHPGAKEKAQQTKRIAEERKALLEKAEREKAEKAKHIEEVHNAFLEKVGDTKTYLSRRIGETHGATLREMRAQLNKAYIDTPEISVGSLIFCFVGFLLSLAMHTDPDMDNNVIYIFFPLAMSIALHKMFDMEFGWIKSCAITFGILILPKILHDFSVDLFDTPTPAFVLLNLICAVPLVVALVGALRKIPANRAYRRAAVLRGELKPVESKLRAELIDEFTPLVGRELAEKWVKELRSGI